MAEVKPQMRLIDQRAFLRDMRPQNTAQCLMQQMCGAVIGTNGRAPRAIDFLMNNRAGRQITRINFAIENMQIAEPFLRVADCHGQLVIITDMAGVTDLPAAFGIKWRLIDQ